MSVVVLTNEEGQKLAEDQNQESHEEIPVIVYTGEEDDDPTLLEGADEDHPWKGLYHPADFFLNTDYEDIPFVIEGLLPAGACNLFGGAPKSGKSFFALDMAVSVALGRDFLNEYKCQQGSVLMLALEDSARTLSPRIKKQVDGNPKLLNKLHIITECPRWDLGGQKVVASWIVDNQKDAKLIVVDTHQMFRPTKSMGGGYNNDYNSIAGLVRLAHKTGIPIVVVHHTTKSGADKEWMKAFSGSFGLIGAVDDLSMLRKVPNKKGFGRFYIGGRMVGEEERLLLQFEKSSLRWIISDANIDDEEDDELGIGSVTEMQILAVFMTEPPNTSIPTAEIFKRASLNENTGKTALRKLVQDKKIIRTARGWYKMNDNQFPDNQQP